MDRNIYEEDIPSLINKWSERQTALLNRIYKIFIKDGPLKDREKPIVIKFENYSLEFILAKPDYVDDFYSMHVYENDIEVLAAFVFMCNGGAVFQVNNFFNGFWTNRIKNLV